ncbi:MAG: thioredoxin domain-containing protein, partial [Candidatus Competibacteraceae bacterium]|nr:thioredoxin domain-containing protein [Candidatus Competibacteraceae bacterium]
MTEPAHTNRLIHETSPYLRQHAHNPVDWHPWSEEALDKARRENKPILLSIGYSACHWCHVMAHESFENAETAALMNELFVNIKVDREERPDLDKIYQTAFQMLHRRAGGWPLTMFLTHDDHVPFVGGTYFPNRPRYGMPAFVDILRRISDHYRQRPADIRQQNQALLEILHGELAAPSAAGKIELTAAPLQAARDQAVSHFDPTHGGFGGAPKFPHPTSLERLLRHWTASLQRGEPDHQAETAALFTLRKMALGGIYDHLGGGFYRYSVDAEWQIPHFEKMLYDNGPLAIAYLDAYRRTNRKQYREVAEGILRFVTRDMTSEQGTFFSALDAETAGVEGQYYVWNMDEVDQVLGRAQATLFARAYGLDQPAGFEHGHVLRRVVSTADLAEQLQQPEAEISAMLAQSR